MTDHDPAADTLPGPASAPEDPETTRPSGRPRRRRGPSLLSELPPAQLAKFELGRELGRGGHTVVWEARQRSMDRVVAIKISEGTVPELAARMIQEAKILARIDHPGVVDVYELGVTEHDAPFIVMERLYGKSLAEELRDRGPFEPSEVVTIGMAALDALAAVHSEGLIHRDIKPSNVILLDPDRKGERRLKLIDFGIGKDLKGGGERITDPAQLVGTPAYLAPEQLIPHLPVDARTDLYALGATLYHLLTGRPPFESQRAKLLEDVLFTPPLRPSLARASLTPALDPFFERALAKRPGDRFASAEEMAARLRTSPVPLS